MNENAGLASRDRPAPATREVIAWGKLLLGLGLAMLVLGPALSVLWSIWGVLLLVTGALVHQGRQPQLLVVSGIVMVWAGISHLLTINDQLGLPGVALTALGLIQLWRFRLLQRMTAIQPAPHQGPSIFADRYSTPKSLSRTFPLLSYGLGVSALIALPLVFLVGLSTARGQPATSTMMGNLLAGDSALGALGLAFGAAALPFYNPRRPLAVQGMVASSVCLLAFMVIVVVVLIGPS